MALWLLLLISCQLGQSAYTLQLIYVKRTSFQVFDATNTSRSRRQIIYEMCTLQYSYKTFFLESVCTDQRIIDANIMVSISKKKKKNPFVCWTCRICSVYHVYHNWIIFNLDFNFSCPPRLVCLCFAFWHSAFSVSHSFPCPNWSVRAACFAEWYRMFSLRSMFHEFQSSLDHFLLSPRFPCSADPV